MMVHGGWMAGVVCDDGGDDIKAINIWYVLLHVFYIAAIWAEAKVVK